MSRSQNGSVIIPLDIEYLGIQDYQPVWLAMQEYTAQRTPQYPDKIWILEHPPVFTLGRNSKPEHLLNPGDIPVIAIDRGGQVTYHAPGQLVCYLLLDLKRLKLGVRQFITLIENTLITCLQYYAIDAYAKQDAPGVYVDTPTHKGAKIAALGLRVKRACSYHGLSLNVAMDITPFQRINPCGFAQLPITQIQDFVPEQSLHVSDIAQILLPLLQKSLYSKL